MNREIAKARCGLQE